MSFPRIIAVARGLIHGSEARAAEKMRTERFNEACADTEWEKLAQSMTMLKDTKNVVHVGEAINRAEESLALCVELERLWGSHLLINGATGTGKTYAQLGLMEFLLPRVLQGDAAVVSVEGKGELSGLLIGNLLPKALSTLPPKTREAALARINFLSPFSEDCIPVMNLIAPPPGVSSELHLLDLLHAFEVAAEAPLGVRQHELFVMGLKLLAEHKLHLPSFPFIFSNPPLLQRLVLQSSPDLRAYFLHRYPQESEETKGGVLARLERVLALRSSRLSLSAPSCVDFREILSCGVTVISLAAPFGCREAQKFWSAMLVSRLLRAIFARPNDPRLPPAVIASDEAQDFLQGPHAAEAERALTQARSRRVSLWLACQQFAQLEAASPTLAKALRTNCNVQALFRSSPEDSHAMRHILPVSGRHPRPAPAPWEKVSSPFLNQGEEEKFLLDEGTRLPDRVGWWWDRRQPWRAVKFKTREVDLRGNEEMAEELQRRLKHGKWSMPAEELEKCVAEERQRLMTLSGQPEDEDGKTPHVGRRRKSHNLPELG
ncbi:MAG: type IV secretory system conjugative DNA transfer family protein [Deltaproteobacteria bacterium]|nr:type IV secretory system conjugative DNA transfer family protein [Deltaproteobacteria bacterium]